MSKSRELRLNQFFHHPKRKELPTSWVNLEHFYHRLALIIWFFFLLLGLDFMDNTGVDYENALLNAGFGKFHYYLLAVCGLIYLNTAVGITILWVNLVLLSIVNSTKKMVGYCGLRFKWFRIFTSNRSFVLPSATCDFQMTSKDKGWLTAVPMFGMFN